MLLALGQHACLMGKLLAKHGVGDLIGACLGHFFGHHLIELTLKRFFGVPAMKVGRLIVRTPHRLDHLTEERLADELTKCVACFLGTFDLLLDGRHAGRSGLMPFKLFMLIFMTSLSSSYSTDITGR